MRCSRRLGAILAAAWLGCGGSSQQAPIGPRTAPPVDEDLDIDAGQVVLTAQRYQPEAIAPLSMLLVRGPRRQSLDRMRAAVARSRIDRRATPARRALDVHLLATALFEAARLDPTRRAALLGEARAALADVRARDGLSTDDVTLTMGAALAFALDDRAGAEPYLSELASRYADRATGLAARTQLVYARLRDGDDAIAAALVGDATPTAAAPELAYVIAWVRFRAGDGPGAAAAITLAAQGWTAAATRAAIDRDFLLMHARSGLAPAIADDAIAAITSDAARRHALRTQLATGYAFAGRAADAVELLERDVAANPDAAPTSRLTQAELTRYGGDAQKQLAAWRAAAAAVAACASCASERTALGDALAARAVEAHTVFATTGDVSYRALAAELYKLFAAQPDLTERTDRARVSQYAEDFGRLAPPDDNTQYGDAVPALLALRQPEVAACLEGALQRWPTTGGAVRLTLEVDRQGAVAGVAIDPPRGEAGLTAVAGCVEDRARTWTLPTRPRGGVARVQVRYVLGAKP